jgi:TetR/AcrR family transcriptional regulator, regulator of cefoperazone and chloramphenicol sensitivity
MNIYLISSYTVNVKKAISTKARAPRNTKPTKRAYESPIRQQQADETRARITDAATRILTKSGYAGMTIPAVALAAGVAIPTVYAIFGSKKGIIAELLDRARFGNEYHAIVGEALQVTDPLQRIDFAARIARRIYEAEIPIEDLLRGAGMLAPELAAVETHDNRQRYDIQTSIIDSLIDANMLRPPLDRESARDILWTLTSRDLFRMLVRERRWTPIQFEAWLRETLIRELVTSPPTKQSSRR